MNVSDMMPGFWGREYFSDEWYSQNEIPYIRQVWSKAIEDAAFSEYRQSLFFGWGRWTEQAIERGDLKQQRLSSLQKRMTSSVQGGLHRMATARIDQARVKPSSPPRLRHCIVCENHFLEPFDAYQWASQVVGGKWDVCWDCLYDAFPANEQHWRTIRKDSAELNLPPWIRSRPSRKRLISDLRKLVDLLGTTPMLRTNMRGLVLSPTWPKSKRAAVIRRLQRMAVAETYEKEFGSWFEALIAAGVLESDAKRMSRGTLVLAEDGHLCHSMAEKLVDDWLSSHGIPHEREPQYPKHETLNPNGRRRADWKVGAVYIEYLGLLSDAQYRRRAKEKRGLASELGLEVVMLEPHDLARLPEKLSSSLQSGDSPATGGDLTPG
jgi:hypothetical protein